jgi:hypothetical protein
MTRILYYPTYVFCFMVCQTCKVEEDRSLALRIIQIGREVLFNSKISKASAHMHRAWDRSYYSDI